MLAIVAAIVFALALLFDLADYASDAINNGTLTVLGLLLIALHFAASGRARTGARAAPAAAGDPPRGHATGRTGPGAAPGPPPPAAP